MGEPACEAGFCRHCSDCSIEERCDERHRLADRAKEAYVVELESLRAGVERLIAEADPDPDDGVRRVCARDLQRLLPK